MDFWLWNKLANKVKTLNDAAVLGVLLSAVRIADTVQRSVWYSRAKLLYIEDKKGFLQSMKQGFWPTIKSSEDKKSATKRSISRFLFDLVIAITCYLFAPFPVFRIFSVQPINPLATATYPI